MVPTLHIRLLGGPEILIDDLPVHLETAKTLALLAYLVVRPGPHQRDMLADLLWGNQGQTRAARSLRRALWNIRRSLCPGGDEVPCHYLDITRRSVAFRSDSPHTLDLDLFDLHLEAARKVLTPAHSTTSPQVIDHLNACQTLYRGDFLEGLYIENAPTFETWLLGEQAYYRERILQVLSRLSEIHIARGEYEDAILVLQRLLVLAPWSEWGHRQLMFCYALAGRRADALAQYERCRRILREELNADPLPETVHLYRRIRDPQRYARILSQADAHPGDTSSLPPMPFLGRSREHAWLLDQWEHHRNLLTLVEGEAGVGKTRLVEEVLRSLEGRGVFIARGQCYQFSGTIPFHPVVEALRNALHRGAQGLAALAPTWLAELTCLLPELADTHPHLPSSVPIERSAPARQRLFEAVAQALLALNGQGLVLFLDDAHWADPDTVDMVRYLLYRLREAGIWFVIAYRPEDLVPGHPFRLLRQDLGQANRVRILHLHPLQEEDVHRLVAGWPGLGREPARLLASHLYGETLGNPFMLIEQVRDLVDRGVLRRESENWQVDAEWLRSVRRTPLPDAGPHPAIRHLPPAVVHMILARVERLPPPGQRLLRVAAALGEPFTRETLHLIADLPDREADDALSTWLNRGFVHLTAREPTLQYDFAHPLIRQVVYHHIPLTERRLIHERIARALGRRHAGQEDAIVETLAYHYGESRQSDQAIRYLLRAGERAQARQAQEAAIYFYTRALDLIPRDDSERRYQALSGRERAYNQLARRDEQAADLDALWGLAQALDDPIRQAEVLHRRAEWALRTARFHEGIAHARDAQRLSLAQEAFGLAVDAMRMESMCLARVGDFEQAYERCKAGVLLAREIEDRRREVLCLGSLGVLGLDLDRTEDAREHMETALAYWRALGDVWHHAIVCNNLSMLYHRLGNYGRALELQREARSLIPRTGDLGLDAYSWTSLGILYHTIGRYEDALDCYQRALELARIISDRGVESYILSCLGVTHLALKDVEAAERAFRRALSIEEEIEVYFLRPQIWEGLGQCALASGDVVAAREHLLKAHEYFEKDYYPGHTVTLAWLAHIHVLSGDPATAREWVRRYHEALAREATKEPLPETWWLIVQAERALGDTAAADQDLRRAYDLTMRQAASLEEEDRALFLERIPAHREIVADAKKRFPTLTAPP